VILAGRIRAHLSSVLAVVVVLTSYTFFGSVGTMSFRRLHWYETHSDAAGAEYYARLAEGFLHGRLSIAATPDPRLATLPDPYEYYQRDHSSVSALWDASYYRGKYYLYFTPIPALLFYIPFRLVAGGYPPDSLVATFFCAWAFVVAVLFVRRALAGRRTHLPMPLWILLLGLGNVVAFSLPAVRVYEVAIVSGMAMSATWAWSLLRFLEKRTPGAAAWMGVWLALAIAARTNLLVLLAPTAAAIVVVRDHRARARLVGATLLPLFVVGIALAAYNFARFGNVFETGFQYQMTSMPMRGHSVCRLCNQGDVMRFANSSLHYLFWSPAVATQFPYVDLLKARPDPKVSFPGDPEQIVGVAPILPLAMIASCFAALLLLAPPTLDTGTRAGTTIMISAWLVLIGLCTCWWLVARYSLDFMILMAMATVVCIEGGLTLLAWWGVAVGPLRIAAAMLACYSIALGFLLGFEGREGMFRRANPAMFARVATGPPEGGSTRPGAGAPTRV
jgi:hypothetical protein